VTSFKTVAAEITYEPPKIKGSRHIATVGPIRSEARAREFVAEVRTRYPPANHHAYAWRCGRDGESFRYSDDGEPSGSAGQPILRQIDGHGLTNVIVVVSRIFGGTKLGVGGLVRAYGGAASAALDRAEVVVMVPKVRVRVEYGYGLSSAVQATLHGRGVEVLRSDFGASVVQVLEVVEDESEEVVAGLRDATAGQASVEVLLDES